MAGVTAAQMFLAALGESMGTSWGPKPHSVENRPHRLARALGVRERG